MIFYKQGQDGTVFIKNQATSLMVPISSLRSNCLFDPSEETSKKQINGIILSKSLKNKIINPHVDLSGDTSILGVFSNIVSCESINTDSLSRSLIDLPEGTVNFKSDRLYQYLFNDKPFLSIYVNDNWITSIIINKDVKVLPNPSASEKLNSLLHWYFLESNLGQIDKVNEMEDAIIANFKHKIVKHRRATRVPSNLAKLNIIKHLSIAWNTPIDQEVACTNDNFSHLDNLYIFEDPETSNATINPSIDTNKGTIDLNWKH